MIHVHSTCIQYMVQIQYHWKILEFLLYEKNNTTQNDIYFYMFQLYCRVRQDHIRHLIYSINVYIDEDIIISSNCLHIQHTDI